MSLPRRFLPPLTLLISFEAVARTGSVTMAAAELDLTQGAVSRHLQKLEALLALKLFERDRKRLVLTPAAAAYCEEIRGAISQIANATITLRSNPQGGVLDLAILPAFGTYWLAPRLPDFLATHPGVTVNLGTRMAPFDFGQERFHAAIHFGLDNWSGAESLRLMEEEVVPVMSAELAAGRALTPEDLTRLPLLHLETRPRSWARWFGRNSVDFKPPRGMEFDQFATMLRAAAFGLGVALMPRYLVQQELASGSLVTLKHAQMTNVGAYYLVWPEARADYPPLTAFRQWITGQLPDVSSGP